MYISIVISMYMCFVYVSKAIRWHTGYNGTVQAKRVTDSIPTTSAFSDTGINSLLVAEDTVKSQTRRHKFVFTIFYSVGHFKMTSWPTISVHQKIIIFMQFLRRMTPLDIWYQGIFCRFSKWSLS